MMSRAESVSSKLILILIVIFIFNPANAEDVCKLFYNQYPEELKGQKVIVPDNTVALSEYVRVGSPLIVMEPPPEGISIFFIIDHSASMTNKGKDPLGNRFSVLYDLIDTINVHLPKSEVGLAVFRQDLCFSDEDSPYFVKAPNFKVNSYLQLMKLDSVYEG
ncbi:MAG: VWA domain-containing protein, partial [Chitinispirillia bacterium]